MVWGFERRLRRRNPFWGRVRRGPSSPPPTEPLPQLGYSHRPVALGREGMVASAHPLASLAGIEVLKAGGHAVDAAIAVNAVLAVTQPNNCGLGGDIFCLYWEAATRRVHCLNGPGC